jgi:hypothetical protein
MIAEAISKIAELTRKAHAAEVVKIPGVDRVVHLRVGDEIREIAVEAPKRMPTVDGVEDLIAMLKRKDIAPLPEVYVASSEVRAHLDGGKRVEFVSLPLPRTRRWMALLALLSHPAMSVADAIKLLRFDLYGPHATTLLPMLRRVDFSRASTGRVTNEHGRESLGREVEAKVQGAGEIPEEFAVRLPVFDVQGLRQIEQSVTIRIHLAPGEEKIEFHPLEDELRLAESLALEAVFMSLSSSLPEVPIFRGRP